MKKSFFLILVILLVLNQLELKKPLIKISKQDSSINFNEKYLKIFNFGFSSMVSSWLWVKTLLESDVEHYKERDLNSWMFLRFSSIVTLDPKFYEAYLFGGKYLSIIKDDLKGAEIIFSKGLEQYPDDFWLNINAGHNYLFEMGLPEKAIPLYKRVQFQPIAKEYYPILPSLVAKLEKNRGDLKTAFNLLELAKNQQSSEKFTKYFQDNLYSLKAEVDLNCLNNKIQGCDSVDYLGNPYIKIAEGNFKAKYPWKKFQLSNSALNRIKKGI